MLRFIATFLIFQICGFTGLMAQVIWTEPPFPTDNEPVTVYFDATQGTGGLAGCNCEVYVHTGLITSNSTSSSDWKYVFTQWGVANAAWKMDPVPGQPDVYSWAIQPTIRARYNVINPNEEIQKLAFVFRNANGSQEGKGPGGSDIFYDVYPDNQVFTAFLQTPTEPSIFATFGQMIEVKGVASQPANLSITDNGNTVASTFGTELSTTITVAGVGSHLVEFVADNGTEQIVQSFTYIVPTPPVLEPLPPGTELGITYLSDSQVRLAFYAPNKPFAYLIGDFNNWQISTAYQMKRTPDGTTWWLDVSGLTPGQTYGFQYVVGTSIRIGDPYSNLILDPDHDGWIPAANFPNIHPYPVGKTTGIVSLLQPGAPPYPWKVTNFQRPDQTNLVIYELLMRDFLQTQNYQTLLDTLDYLHRLGVTAIEFMPINEFDGNQSWGYNPTYHYALDKQHGTPDAFKAVVDACHERGMAVIIDVVFNHAHEKNPLCMLYWDQANFRPAPDNPWLNPLPTHDFNVFFDFNHESPHTRYYVIRTLQHLLDEYKVDGFRFDLSKGFTQKVTIGNVGAWGQYDAERIAVLKLYADAIWDNSPGAYVILEHFADNSEEKELADYGMMLWAGGTHDQFKEAAMGWNSNFSGASYKSRNWNDPHLIVYMESHDEERMMYKNLQFGNSSGSYNVKNMNTALARTELTSTFFYSIPGPKMLWQFGELGYDYSINHCTNGTVSPNCRLDPKPIRWDYMGNPARLSVYNTTRSLLHLRNNYEVFRTTNFQLNTGGPQKTIHLNHSTMNVTVLGNFAVQAASITPNFQHTGWWYEYFTGDSINVAGVSSPLNFQPGEYRLYTDVRIEKPVEFTDSKETLRQPFGLVLSPNPSSGEIRLEFELERAAQVELSIQDMQGRQALETQRAMRQAGRQIVTWATDLSPGVYFVKMQANGMQETQKLVILNK